MASLQDISALIAARKPADAAAGLQKLVKKSRKSGVDLAAAMRLAASLGDTETALAAAKAHLALASGDPQRVIFVIEALGACAKHAEAATLARSLQSKPMAAADGYYLEGVFRARLGQRDEALALFRNALQQNAGHAAAWEQIALLDGYGDFASDLTAMQALAARMTSPEQKMTLLFALGRAFDHIDDVDQAFVSYAEGAALREAITPYNSEPLLAYLERRRQVFTPELIQQFQNQSGGENFTFILSAPRSGTTLVEQILATSPRVTATGEHTLLRLATLKLGSMEPQDMANAASGKDGEWRKMAHAFQTSIRKRFGLGGHYTDKTMINYYYAGAIRILFPQAKMVWCHRDLRDTAWSCFRSRITAGNWAQTLENSVQFLQAHDRLCQHWVDQFGASIVDLSYEDLVQAPEASTADLFEKTGIARPDNWENFYAADNPVATASLAQVRKPLNAKAVGSWKRYEAHLAPVFDRLIS
jgi:hypothetical protein